MEDPGNIEAPEHSDVVFLPGISQTPDDDDSTMNFLAPRRRNA